MKQSTLPINLMQEKADQTVHLLSAFQSGDTSAFSSLYDLYINVLYNYGHKLTTDKELLKDCIHDVFVRLYMRRSEVCSIENFKSYMFISLKNKLCDEIRKRIYMSETADEETNPVAMDNVEESYLNREKEKWNNMMVDKLLKQLSPRQREALTLYYIEEKKVRGYLRDYEHELPVSQEFNASRTNKTS